MDRAEQNFCYLSSNTSEALLSCSASLLLENGSLLYAELVYELYIDKKILHTAEAFTNYS